MRREERVTRIGLTEIGTGDDRGLVAARSMRELTPILGCTPCYTGPEPFIPTDALIVYNLI